MELSKREKNLLTILAIVLFIFVFYKFLINPRLDSLAELKVENEMKNQEVMKLRTMINSEKRLDEEISREREKITKLEPEFFGRIQQEELILILDKLWKDNGIKAETVAFKKEQSLDGSDNEEEEGNLKNIELNKVQVNFEGGYSSIVNFLSDVDVHQKKIITSSLTLNNQEEGIITGNFVLDFYCVPFINDYIPIEKSALADDLMAKSNYYNPFTPYPGFFVPTEEIIDNLPKPSDDSIKDEIKHNKVEEKEEELVPDKMIEYLVKQGDKIDEISKTFYGDYDKVKLILKYNDIKDINNLKVGRKLLIPYFEKEEDVDNIDDLIDEASNQPSSIQKKVKIGFLKTIKNCQNFLSDFINDN